MKKPNEKQILIYADWEALGKPTLMGTLTSTLLRGKEIFAFEYEDNWLKHHNTLYLDPNLGMYNGRQFLPDHKANFGIFHDSSPDRWGRVLMKRREAILARNEDRNPNPFFESDYLLGVFDLHRMGAIRFKLKVDGPFLNDNKTHATPPWADLRNLEYLIKEYELDDESNPPLSIQWLNLLIAPGSSLGGARPKASVIDPQGNLWIAKFPSQNDHYDIAAWEMVAHHLALQAGLHVPPAQIKTLASPYHTFLSQRFDRTATGGRTHFASAMTLLGYQDGDNHATGASYLDLVAFIQQQGAAVNQDLEELWRRIVFNICISNTDDHLRNHGFLLTQQGWRLSPAYDINPTAHATGLTLNISENDNSLNLDIARDIAPYFRLTKVKNEKLLDSIIATVKDWKAIATHYAIPPSQIQSMSTAFSHF